MRLSPSQHRHLKTGICLWCGKHRGSHTAESFVKDHERYAKRDNATYTDNQLKLILKQAKK